MVGPSDPTNICLEAQVFFLTHMQSLVLVGVQDRYSEPECQEDLVNSSWRKPVQRTRQVRAGSEGYQSVPVMGFGSVGTLQKG
jgi:hypothetical protein